VRFLSSFVDQGVALRPMQGRDAGLYACFLRHYRSPFVRWAGAWGPALRRLADAELRAARTPIASLAASLAALGVATGERERFLRETALSLPGWSGLVCQLEARPDRTPVRPVHARLDELLAVFLLVERATLPVAIRDAGLAAIPLDELRDRLAAPEEADSAALSAEERAWRLFCAAPRLGLRPEDLDAASLHDAGRALSELERTLCACDGPFVRRVLHEAFEAALRADFLDALAAHGPHRPPRAPAAQAVFCVDDREESIRRHLEDVAPTVETFGFAGFFGVPAYVLAAPDARPRPRAPAAIEPEHYLAVEVPEPSLVRRASARYLRLLHGKALHIGSRGILRGALLAALGALALPLLVARVLAPWRARHPAPELAGHLHVERRDGTPPAGTHCGFDPDEMAGIVARTLAALGLSAARQAPLVALVGHTAGSVNNPHRSAYDCGACGGSPGGTNARAFAAMANHSAVRERLAARGAPISEATWFVAAEHDTTADTVAWYDLEAVPPSHRDAAAALRRACDEASARNAAERCRRFDEQPPLPPERAARHVRGRRMDLAQPRPEYNHATNAFCVVARRERTRGLFLDRRAFLVSYDPLADTDGSALIGLLTAVSPVVAGINLEYLFGTVDNAGYGSGTKLPHNIHGLVGVTSGAGGDLRTGLWAQTVEIHEPVRMTMVVERDVAGLLEVLGAVPYLKRLVDNRWLFLVALSPDDQSLTLLGADGPRPYEPRPAPSPIASDWLGWLRGQRGDLPFVRRDPASSAASEVSQ
jgi:uncharacterized protein YbcC (UPF0753/DUF2309 family)